MRSFLAPLTSASAALTACAPTPQEVTRAPDLGERATAAVTNGIVGGGIDTAAAIAPMLDPVSAAENPYPTTPMSPPEDADAEGRRTVSTAFVRLGPGGHLSVSMRDGRQLALRDVTMEKRVFCGVPIADGRDERSGAGERQCYPYGEVTAARAVDAATGIAPIVPG